MSDANDPYAETSRRLNAAAQQHGCDAAALEFVLQALAYRPANMPQGGVTPQDLCWQVRGYAIATWNGKARSELTAIGIASTADIGKLVEVLIAEELMREEEGDDLSDFQDVFDFEEAFKIDEHGTDAPLRQWKLSTLFLITTMAAIMAAGASNAGVEGALGAVGGAWLATIGGIVTYSTLMSDSRQRRLEFAIGIGFFVMGFVVFAYAVWIPE